jgi:hypothetical protein
MPMAQTSRIAAVFILLAFAAGAAARIDGGPKAAAVKTAPCDAPNYRQFDFWIGDWDVFDSDNLKLKVARVRVEPILNGCVLRETYEATDGHQGQSFSIFDASRQVWHQSWVTNSGQLLIVEGGMQSGAMILNGVDRTPDGKERRVRGIWKAASAGVRESATRSIDGGLTWKPWFDLLFRPHQDDHHRVGALRSRATAPTPAA